ncbi:MAG: SCP2 sterol-binding domain-containing protein [Actinobacteria bacterium]|nr:SCP2 sterol-binding domain-containing protein [Actinomycetota bacterium]
MGTKEELAESLNNFQTLCLEEPDLPVMLKGWKRNICVEPGDIDADFTIEIKNGKPIVKEGKADHPDIIISADSDLLIDLFWGDIGPTEPYSDENLKVEGEEEDVIKVDSITALLWGE